jgi:DNA-directed RNA polymerase specialized sigma24 family protein
MHYLLGMPLREVAATLGIPMGTAKSRLHYSLAAMRSRAVVEASLAAIPVSGGRLA